MKDTGLVEQATLSGFVIATKRVAEDEQKVCFMYRETPMDPQDSGWRLFAGDESQEYVDDPSNSGIYQPANILMIDDSISALLSEPIGSAFEREDGAAVWRPADGFHFGHGDEIEAHELGGGWHIEVSGIFDRHEEEEGDTVFAAEGRTVRIAIWDFSEKSHEEIITLHRDFIKNREQSDSLTIEEIEFEENGVVRMGFVVQEADETRQYKVLYGYTIIGLLVAQGAFYFDVDDDREWAIATWNSIGIE